MRRHLFLIFILWALAPAARAAGNYSVVKRVVEGHPTYHLLDAKRKMDFGVVPQLGNLAYEFKVNGKDVLIAPKSLKEYGERHSLCCGIPFLAPWANRIDKDYYYFEGNKYLLNDSLGNLIHVPPYNLVMHGLLVFDPHWRVVRQGASGADGAFVTSRLDFYKYPALMAQFPFAQVYEVTYRLKAGKIENITRVINKGAGDVPVHFGYHPFLQPDGAREDWQVSINAKLHWKVDDHKRLIPTGETEPASGYIPNNTNFTLGKTFIDDAFSGLHRDADGLGHYSVKGKTETIELVFGKDYDFGHVYAPPQRNLICFEPQTGPTNAFNLNHDGKFPGLVILKPRKSFEAHFWIVPSGF